MKITYLRVLTQVSIWKYFVKYVREFCILKFINLGGSFVQMNLLTQQQV
jgi:hypothetical protein